MSSLLLFMLFLFVDMILIFDLFVCFVLFVSVRLFLSLSFVFLFPLFLSLQSSFFLSLSRCKGLTDGTALFWFVCLVGSTTADARVYCCAPWEGGELNPRPGGEKRTRREKRTKRDEGRSGRGCGCARFGARLGFFNTTKKNTNITHIHTLTFFAIIREREDFIFIFIFNFSSCRINRTMTITTMMATTTTTMTMTLTTKRRNCNGQ